MNKKGFSLIEILVVLLLISIVYGIYFYSQQKTNKELEYSVLQMKKYMTARSNEYETLLRAIYSADQQTVYITDHQYTLLETISLNRFFTQYVLKEDEKLEVMDYKSIQIGDWYVNPTFVMTQHDKEIFSNIILFENEKNEWIYFNSYFGNDYERFQSENELIDFIKKKEYMPMYAGKIE